MKTVVFQWVNLVGRLRARLWTELYRPFLGQMASGARMDRAAVLTNPHRVFLGKNTAIACGARIEAITEYRGQSYSGRIVIGDATSVQPYAHIAAAAELIIGHRVLTGSRVFITDHDHQFTDPEVLIGDQPLVVAPVRINDRVWLGENVAVLKGVTIGNHAVIGANSVVTRDLPPYAVAAGAPARVLRIWTPEKSAHATSVK